MFESPDFCVFYSDLRRFEFESLIFSLWRDIFKNAVIPRLLRCKMTLPDLQVSSTCSNWVGSFILVRDGRLELPTSCSQSKRATNCANPGFLGIQFCSRCGQTCGQAVFLTTSTCGGSACIVGVSRDCGHGIFRLERGASCSQSKRATNCANPGFLVIEF